MDVIGNIDDLAALRHPRPMQHAIRSWLKGFVLAAAILTCMGQSVDAQTRPASFVDVSTVVPSLVVDMRYFGTHNFVGARVEGYDAPVCILTRQAAAALAAVQRDLLPRQLGLKVFDCYRPVRAVSHFVRWARDPGNTTKAEFYPDIDKRNLFREGYISQRSGHSRGSTVDLTLVSLPNNQELDMGTPFDFLSPRAGSRGIITPEQRANRKILSDVMRKHGFIPYEKEWWHFTLRNEPFPGSYFDFPVR